MSDRQRNLFILLLVLGLMAASAVVVGTKTTRLGLDLKGGVELVYEGKPTPQVPKVDNAALDRALDILRKRVDSLGVAEPEITRAGTNQLVVSLPGVPDAKAAEDQVGTTASLQFYDWETNVLGADCKPPVDPLDVSVTETPITGKEGAVKRASRCPGENDANDTTTGPTFYAFDKAGKQVGTGATQAEALADSKGQLPPGGHVYQVKRGVLVVRAELPDNATKQQKANWDQWYVIKDDPSLKGDQLKNPEQNYDNGTNEPIVTFDFTNSGRKAFSSVTRKIAQRGAEADPTQPAQNRLQHFAIVLDNELVSRPTIDFTENPDGIDGSTGAQISGGFTTKSAQNLAEFLKIGALPIRLELISRSQVSATLGKQALNQGLVAGLVGLGLVAVFLLVFYRVLGLIAVAGLAVYSLYFYALIKLIPITMTLPGIAGLVLTIGVAADANIVIFERVKEEVRAGRSVAGSIATGYKKGFATILDANIVTLLTAFILFILATAGVKGFALTLGIGTIVSLFTAYLATQAVLLSMRNTRLLQSRAALGARGEKRPITFDFMGSSKWFFSASGLILLVGALAIAGNGINFGIDFESGVRIKTPIERKANVDDVRSKLGSIGYGDAKVQTLSDKDLGPNVLQISIKNPGRDKKGSEKDAATRDAAAKIKDLLNKQYGVPATGFSADTVGPTFGNTVAKSAVYAIVASLLVISIYIALRFEWKFAVPVLIALMHDVLITAGVYALFDREVTTSTVAALLTLLGYSLYDTIIVFDRIRENAPRMPSAAFSQIVNRSMSEVVVRSLATSFCTVLPVLALLLFGGDTLKDFAFALLVGVLSGTYSSVFIASPVLTHWKEREPVYQARERRIRDLFGGLVPAYAVATAGAPVDIAPNESRRRRQRAADPAQGVSREEFEDMVRDLHVETPPDGDLTPTQASATRTGSSKPKSTGGASTPTGGRRAARRAAGTSTGGTVSGPGADASPTDEAAKPDVPDTGRTGEAAKPADDNGDSGRGSGGRRKRNKHGRPR